MDPRIVLSPTIKSPSIHESLPLVPGQIRLFQLIPIENSDAIYCLLKVFDFHDGLEYKALSYEWGQKDYRMIYVNGLEFPVRANLHEFLKVANSWEQAPSTWMWIDQISINQFSTTERNQQVTMMDHIYREASETYMWLGPDPYGGLAFSTILRVTNRCGAEESLTGFWRKVDSCELQDLTLSTAELASLSLLNGCGYWTRHWIIQEILLSSKRTIVFGDSVLPWLHVKSCMAGAGNSTGSVALDYLLLIDDGLGGEADCCFRRNREHAGQTPILFWSMALHTDCTDPRDKVYAIQNLLPLYLRIRVDYDAPVWEVFLQAVRTFLRYLDPDNQSFLFFRACGYLARGMGLKCFNNFKKAMLHGQPRSLESIGTVEELEAYVTQLVTEETMIENDSMNNEA